jgi:membrane-bound lytic murein transglycosylase D
VLLLGSTSLLNGCAIRGVIVDSATTAAQPGSPMDADRRATRADEMAVLNQAGAAATVWPRVRRDFRLSDIKHPRIDAEVERLLRSPRALNQLLERSRPFIFHIVETIEAADLPGEITLLPAVESGFRPYAYSPDGAAGLWQFMPATGSMMGLHQDWWFDSRRTVRAATDAAAAYLQRNNKRFDGDWLHTLAAYNAGSAKVARSIRRAQKRGEPTDFWSLDLPGETDRYVPRLLALARIVGDPDRYGITLPDIPNHPHFDVVDTGGQIDLNVAAQAAGMDVDELLRLNAGHRRWTTGPDGPHELLVPAGLEPRLAEVFAGMALTERMRWQRHEVIKGESLYVIGRRYGVSVAAIKRSNQLTDSRLQIGQELMIPLSELAAGTTLASNSLAQQRLSYRVQKGDSLYKIARRFQVTIDDLKRWNRVGRYIRPGERLTVYIDPDA